MYTDWRKERRREVAGRDGYATLRGTPLGPVRMLLVRPRGTKGPSGGDICRHRVQRARMRYGLAWVKREAEIREISQALDELVAMGDIAQVGDSYMAWPPRDKSYSKTKAMRSMIFSMWESDATLKEIALALNTSIGTIQSQLSRMRHAGWPLTYRRNWTAQSLEEQRHVWRARGLPKRPKRPKPTSKQGVSEHVGVCPYFNGKWRAYGYEDNRQVYLGIYGEESEAAEARYKWQYERLSKST